MMQIEIPKPDMNKAADRAYLWRLSEAIQQFVNATTDEIQKLQTELKTLKGEKQNGK